MTKQICDFCRKEITDAHVEIIYSSKEPFKFLKKDICQKCQKSGVDFLKGVYKKK